MSGKCVEPFFFNLPLFFLFCLYKKKVRITATTSTASICLRSFARKHYTRLYLIILLANSVCVYQITEGARQLFGHLELP